MKIAEIIGATLYFIGFLMLVPWETFPDFIAFRRKRIDSFGAIPRPEKHPAWSEKYKPFMGWLCLVLGSAITLILMIFRYCISL